MFYILMAWRNLWRNKHRTFITIASVFFAVVLVLFTRSMQLGTYENTINNTLKLSTAYLQVHKNKFWEKHSIDYSMMLPDSLLKKTRAIPHVTSALPGIESFALASSGDNTQGVMVTGIDPAKENELNQLSQKIIDGQYLTNESSGVLVGSKLAQILSVEIGDTLVLLSQGYHGISAAAIFMIDGIVKLPVPELNRSVIYMTVPAAQAFFGTFEMVTTLAIMIDEPDKLSFVENELRSIFSQEYEIMNWREMMPELVQSIEIDNAGGIIMLGILYLVIGFGIFGTVMMMVAERKREFAILISVGMKRWKIIIMVFLESIMIGLLGAITGALASIPLLLYMREHPIRLTGTAAEAMLQYGFEPLLPFLVEPHLFVNHTFIVMIISLIGCLYPLLSITRLKVSNTLRA